MSRSLYASGGSADSSGKIDSIETNRDEASGGPGKSPLPPLFRDCRFSPEGRFDKLSVSGAVFETPALFPLTLSLSKGEPAFVDSPFPEEDDRGSRVRDGGRVIGHVRS